MDTKTVLGVSSISAMLLFLVYMKQRRAKKTKTEVPVPVTNLLTEDDAWNKVIFSSDDAWNKVIFFSDDFLENEDSITRQLIWYLEQAKSSIDVCVFGSQFPMLRDTLIGVAKRGVVIRIMTNTDIFDKRTYGAAGIQTRCKLHLWKREETLSDAYIDLLHHKFVVIDRVAGMAGSLNWTWESINKNREYVAIFTQPNLVEKYVDEFERLWEECGRKLTINENVDQEDE